MTIPVPTVSPVSMKTDMSLRIHLLVLPPSRSVNLNNEMSTPSEVTSEEGSPCAEISSDVMDKTQYQLDVVTRHNLQAREIVLKGRVC